MVVAVVVAANGQMPAVVAMSATVALIFSIVRWLCFLRYRHGPCIAIAAVLSLVCQDAVVRNFFRCRQLYLMFFFSILRLAHLLRS